MILRKKETTPKVEKAVAKAVNYEVTIADLAQRSAKRAWIVAGCSLVVSLILIGGYFYMLPLKEKVPYLIMADAYSGNASVARLRGNFTEDNSITANEAINRSNVARYVMAREAYDYEFTRLYDWVTVHAMSSSAVSAGYTNTIRGNSPDSMAQQMGRTKSLRVSISSIIFNTPAQGRTPTSATVRFQRRVYDKTNGVTKFLDSRIATLVFAYNKDLKMDDRSRVANPLGFQVTNYTVTADNASPAPAEIAGDEAAATLGMMGQSPVGAVPLEGAETGAVDGADAATGAAPLAL